MRRSFNWEKKYFHWGITAFLVVAASIAFYLSLNHIAAFGRAFSKFISVMSPFIWGFVFAYFLSPIVNALEENVFKIRNKNKHGQKQISHRFARGISVFVAELVLLVILAALVWMIIPQLYNSVETIVKNSSSYYESFYRLIERMLEDYPAAEEYVLNIANSLSKTISSWFENALPEIGTLVTNLSSGVFHAISAVYNLVIGIIVSVYVLGDKEHFSANMKRVLFAVFSVAAAEKIQLAIKFSDRTFRDFFTGKLLDSAIIGVICYIGCSIMQTPYTLLISVIIGVTNIIPFFGPLIGAVPAAFLVLFVSPIKCLLFVIFIIVLQQVDGNIIGPKILGQSVGINGFWVMFSIIVGAGLFGFWGMLLGVPVFVVFYTGINMLIERKLKKSDLPYSTEDYIDLIHIEPATLKLTYKYNQQRVPDDATDTVRNGRHAADHEKDKIEK